MLRLLESPLLPPPHGATVLALAAYASLRARGEEIELTGWADTVEKLDA